MASEKTIEELYDAQSSLGEEIKRFYINYPKLSTAERTNLATVNTKINKVCNLIKQFNENHSAIIALVPNPEDEYFKLNYYKLIIQKHDEELKKLFNDKRSIESKIPPVDSWIQSILESTIDGSASTKQRAQQKHGPSLSIPVNQPPSRASSPGTIPSSKVDLQKLIKTQIFCMGMLEKKMEKVRRRLEEGTLSGTMLEVQVEDLHFQWSKMIVEYHRKIMISSIDQQLEGYNPDDFSGMEDRVEQLIADLVARQRSEDLNNSSREGQSGSSRNEASNNSDVGLAVGMVHLPKIPLPEFDGDYLKWSQFKNLFQNMIGNAAIAKSQKLHYLKSSLVGEAKSIATLMDSNMDDYDRAWTRLTEKYDNERILTSLVVEKLFNQPSVKEDSALKLRELKEVSKECISNLKGLKVDVSGCESLIVFLLIKKIDSKSREFFELQLENPTKNPSLTNFFEFLDRRSQALESMGKSGAIDRKKSNSQSTKVVHGTTNEAKSNSQNLCVCCKEKHNLFDCKRFEKFNNRNKFNFVFKRNICCRCLMPGHNASDCTKPKCTIKDCGRNHHPILHRSDKKTQDEAKTVALCTSEIKAVLQCENSGKENFVFLGTVILFVKNSIGMKIRCRALLDSCSQLNIISLKLSRKLGCRLLSDSTEISSVDSGRAVSNSKVEIEIFNRDSSFKASMECVVLSKVSSYLPIEDINLGQLDVKLADEHFNNPDSIDLLLGSDIYSRVVRNGIKYLGSGLPNLLNSAFGWVVLGGYEKGSHHRSPFCGITAQEADFYLKAPKLWELEDCSVRSCISLDDQRVESIFAETTSRTSDGKFMVTLPKVENPSSLGNSYKIALSRFLSLEKRFTKDPALLQRYQDFLNEYLDLNHMSKTSSEEIPEDHYYLPHHAVFKEDSSTTKIRVVFDGSCKTSSNVSLNDILLKGPTLQDDILSLLLRFRTHRFVVCADIEKMFRQIWVTEADQFLQLILWRSSPSDPISTFRLKTVTYGTAPATYLSTKCLQTLAIESQDFFPNSSEVLLKDMYVDDLITGADSVEEVLKLQKELVEILSSGGFHLRKWAANDVRLLNSIPILDREFRWKENNDESDHVKTLGILWKPISDSFSLVVQKLPTKSVVTKRVVSAEAGSVFDPLGLMSPFLLKAKILIQDLWKKKFDWDEELPKELGDRWSRFRSDMSHLEGLEVPRYVGSEDCFSMELHGFSDASKHAYGAAVYVRSLSNDGSVSVKLFTSRSKVAPIRDVSIPRLELAGAKLLVELLEKVQSSLRGKVDGVHYWTDSQVVLWWLKKPSAAFKPFVANRVSFIQEFSDVNRWHYVPGDDNPADIVSRGSSVPDLLKSKLWFSGPSYLLSDSENWPKTNVGFEISVSDPESECKRNAVVLTLTVEEFDLSNMFQVKHSNSFSTLQRIVGYMGRFISNCRKRNSNQSVNFETLQKLLNKKFNPDLILETIPPLTVEELECSTKSIVRYLQSSLCDIKNDNKKFQKLMPFRDNEGILRVGGRLKNACIPFDAKHQILLPQCKITLMLLRQIHRDNHHVPPQTLLSITRQKFWPVNGARSCSKIFYHCVPCFRARPRSIVQLMGNLPATRTNMVSAFAHTGVDYAGPVKIHYRIRGKQPDKAYIAVFVCFSVKAVHLELVGDLTAVAFLNCLKRFIARRGKPLSIHSDNATNFMGCNEELKRQIDFLETKSKLFDKFSANRGIKWEPIPPGSPHFGGLWESSVKRLKCHLAHFLKDRKLTFEELNTVLIEIEAILNSRPLTVQSENPADLKPLTPNNFLISGDCHLLPEWDMSDVKPHLLKGWELISRIRQEYWSRLALEYFHTLQDRAKWLKLYDNIKEDTVVLLKNANTPPTKWEMGLITEVIKGNDDVVRVVDVKTEHGTKRRAITQVCPFPPLDENSMFTWEKKKGESSSNAVHTLNTGSETKRKASRPHIMSTLLFIILIFPLCFAGNSVNITKFDNHPGIFFDGVGKVNIVNNEWHILMYFNLTSYWQQCKNFDMYVSKIKSLCNNQACENVVSQLSVRVKTIEEFNVLIKQECQMREHLRSNRSKRSYKAPLNAIGSFAFRWFGTLDSTYADKVETAIANAKSNEEKLLTLVKNQTTIFDSTVNIMKANNKEFESKLYALHNDTEYLKDFLKQQSKSVLFNTMASNLMLVLSCYRETQLQIHDTLREFKKGRLNALLIDPKELEDHLVELQNTLGMKYKLPTIQFSELETIVQMATVFGTNCLIFQIEVPLLKLLDHDLYRMIPVPTYSKGVFTFLKPIRQFLAINLQERMYYFMSTDEFKSCIEFYEIMICRQQHVMFHISEDNHCEVNFYLHRRELTNQCDVRTSQQNDFWIELHRPNQWLYALTETYTLRSTCDGDVPFQSLQIEGEGILELSPRCNVVVNDVEISGKSSNYSSLLLKRVPPVLPPFNITDDIPIKESKNPFIVSLQNLDSISEDIEKLKVAENVTLKPVEITNEYVWYTSSTVHVASFSFTGLLLIFLIALCVYVKCCRSKENRVKVEIEPKPRQQFNLEDF